MRIYTHVVFSMYGAFVLSGNLAVERTELQMAKDSLGMIACSTSSMTSL